MKREYARAQLQGIEARQRGKKRDANPYQHKPALRVLAEAWVGGWQSEDQLIRGKSR